MKTLLDIENGNLLELDSKVYRLLEVVGRGGSSVVYKAQEDGKGGEYYVIKEFYPYDLEIQRIADGSVCPTDDKKKEYKKRMARALSESEIARELRYDDEIKNNIPWFLSYDKPIQKNETLYTVIATEAGDMLSRRIKTGFFVDRDFIYICECVLKILDALEPIHSKGYLHLDVAPDNIHFSDLGIARLIDYNSTYQIGGDNKDWIPSSKAGYSAIELTKHTATKLPAITLATDLYSVTAIFFELLKKRPPEENDWSNPERWYLSSKEGYLKDATELLVKNTNAFLRKGLSKLATNRFKSVIEMREKIAELIKLKAEFELVNNRKRPYDRFVGRKAELALIDKHFEQENYVFLEGIGGIGKTELAKRYAWEYRDKYDIIQFVTFNESLLSTVSMSLRIQNFDYTKYERNYPKEEIMQRIFEDKMTCLQKYDKRTLIVVDNYNVAADDNFHRFVSGEYKVIFTSREKHSGNIVEINSMSSESDLLILFREYYSPTELSSKDEIIIHEIMTLVLGHTMAVMLIASAMRVNEVSPEEMLKRLQTSLDPELLEKIPADKEEISAMVRDQVMYQHVLNLFNMEIFSDDDTINKNCNHIMTNLAIAPYFGLAIDTFIQWAFASLYENDYYKDINRLIGLRWVQFDEETQSISLHTVISDVANKKLLPNSAKCNALIKEYIELAADCEDKTYIEKADCVNMLELASKRIKDETETTAELLSNFSKLNNSLARYEVALKFFKVTAVILEKAFGEKHPDTAGAYINISIVLSNLGDYSKAQEWNQKALVILEKVLGKKHPDVANTYNNIAAVHVEQGEYSKALTWFLRSLSLLENELGKGHPDTSPIIGNIASLYARQGEYSKALKWFIKSLAIMEDVSYTIYPDGIAIIYSGIAAVYDNQGDYLKAHEWHKKALIAFEKTLGKEHPKTASVYHNIAVTYHKQGEYSKALEWYQKALIIKEKIFSNKHPDTAITYSGIASAYDNLGHYSKSLEWHKKALKVLEKTLGNEHPYTAAIFNNIALIYHKQGDYKEALEWFQRSLVIKKKVFGKEHFDTASTYTNIAAVYEQLGAYGKALELYRKALMIFESNLGKNDRITATTYNNIANICDTQGDCDEALEWYDKALRIRENVLGLDHPDTAATYSNIAGTFKNQGDFAKALKWYQKALDIFETVNGKDHPDTAVVYNNIALVYTKQGDYTRSLGQKYLGLKIAQNTFASHE